MNLKALARGKVGGTRRRVWMAMGVASLLIMGVTAAGSAAPFNDPVGKAQRVNPFAQTMGTNLTATTEVGEDLQCDSADIGSTVWYWFSAPGGSMSVDTAGSGYDTTLAVYKISPTWDMRSPLTARDLTEVACNDDGFPDGLDSLATFETNRGVRYAIQVGGYEGEQGAFKLRTGRPR